MTGKNIKIPFVPKTKIVKDLKTPVGQDLSFILTGKKEK